MSNLTDQLKTIRDAVTTIERELRGPDKGAGYSREELLQTAFLAVRMYAETHPRPTQVTQGQAAEMLGVSRPTVSRLVRAGNIKLNKAGQIPVAEIDRALAAV